MSRSSSAVVILASLKTLGHSPKGEIGGDDDRGALVEPADQLDAVYEHGLAYARSQEFYDTTLFWQWMRLPGDVVFALGALLMAWDFIVKLRPLLPRFVVRLLPASRMLQRAVIGAR